MPRCAPQVLHCKTRLPRSHHFAEQNDGALAQLGERLICIQEVRSSILLGSTITFMEEHIFKQFVTV